MNEMLRHTVVTLAYRGGKVVRAVLARGEKTWNDATPQSWEREVARFFDGLQRLDQQLASTELQCKPERLFQGPIADALTHVGQIAILRRIAGAPVRGENYFGAEIVAGRVGDEQATPQREFD